MNTKPIVDWGCACGRVYLTVNGFVVAMEGDVLRDLDLIQKARELSPCSDGPKNLVAVNHWTANLIKYVADQKPENEDLLKLKMNPGDSANKQIAELEQSKDDFGVNISKETFDFADEILFSLKHEHNIPTPFLYPTSDGGLRAEWPAFKYNLALEMFENKLLKFFVICPTDRSKDLLETYEPGVRYWIDGAPCSLLKIAQKMEACIKER